MPGTTRTASETWSRAQVSVVRSLVEGTVHVRGDVRIVHDRILVLGATGPVPTDRVAVAPWRVRVDQGWSAVQALNELRSTRAQKPDHSSGAITDGGCTLSAA